MTRRGPILYLADELFLQEGSRRYVEEMVAALPHAAKLMGATVRSWRNERTRQNCFQAEWEEPEGSVPEPLPLPFQVPEEHRHGRIRVAIPMDIMACCLKDAPIGPVGIQYFEMEYPPEQRGKSYGRAEAETVRPVGGERIGGSGRPLPLHQGGMAVRRMDPAPVLPEAGPRTGRPLLPPAR